MLLSQEKPSETTGDHEGGGSVRQQVESFDRLLSLAKAIFSPTSAQTPLPTKEQTEIPREKNQVLKVGVVTSGCNEAISLVLRSCMERTIRVTYNYQTIVLSIDEVKGWTQLPVCKHRVHKTRFPYVCVTLTFGQGARATTKEFNLSLDQLSRAVEKLEKQLDNPERRQN